RFASAGQGRVEDIGALLQLAHGLAESAAADVVTADDKARGQVEVKRVENGQGGDKRGIIGQAATQSREPDGRGCAHAAAGADQPESSAAFAHGSPFGKQRIGSPRVQASCHGTKAQWQGAAPATGFANPDREAGWGWGRSLCCRPGAVIVWAGRA